MKTLNDLRALYTEVRRLAKESPGFVYKDQHHADGSCSYLGSSRTAPEQGEGCIVGQALVNTDLATRGSLVQFEGTNARAVIMEILTKKHGIEYADEEFDTLFALGGWFRMVQSDQDQGIDWGTAVRRADMREPGTVKTLSATA